jgi:hypothetical protein
MAVMASARVAREVILIPERTLQFGLDVDTQPFEVLAIMCNPLSFELIW